jgi:hypothetical protein
MFGRWPLRSSPKRSSTLHLKTTSIHPDADESLDEEEGL